MIVRRIAPFIERRKPRVAAYARVSTASEEQAESFETQVDYYTRLIRQNADWEYADVYADRGKSATSAAHRPEFQRMLSDASKRKFDILLVKGISRFSRNVVDAQNYVHELKRYDVEVRFEQEAISSANPASEIMFNILAATAQEETRNKSEHVKWSYRKLAERGIRHIGNNRVLGYDEVNGVLSPNNDAWIVKTIFERYAAGASLSQIVKSLNEAGAKRLRSDKPFNASIIHRMLSNEIYVGDRLLQKQAPHNYLTKRPDPTISYTYHYKTDDHPPIVDRDTWNRVRDRLKANDDNRSKGVNLRTNAHFLYGTLYCAECGAPYKRRTIKGCDNTYVKSWNCAERQKGKKGKGCTGPMIRETTLLKTISQTLHAKWIDEEHFNSDICKSIQRIEISKEGIKVLLKES